MKTLQDIAKVVIGLFIDDGKLALWVVSLIAVVSSAVLWLGLPALWGGGLLLVGCIVILATSILHVVRPRGKIERDEPDE